jgi:hypothetical protein
MDFNSLLVEIINFNEITKSFWVYYNYAQFYLKEDFFD